MPDHRPPTQPLGRQRRAAAGAGSRPARPALHLGCVAGRRHDSVRPDHLGRSRNHHAHRGGGLRRPSSRRQRCTAISCVCPRAELFGARSCVVCGASVRSADEPGADVWPFLRRTRALHVGPSTRAHLHSLRRTVVRTAAVPGMPQRGGHVTGAAADDRRAWQQAHSERVPARIGVATASACWQDCLTPMERSPGAGRSSSASLTADWRTMSRS